MAISFRTSSDVAGGSEVTTRVRVGARTSSDTVGGTDAALSRRRTTSDTVGGTDSAVVARTYVSTSSDVAGGTDAAVRPVSVRTRTAGDTAGGTAVATRVRKGPRTGADTAGGTAVAVRNALTRARTTSDTAGATDVAISSTFRASVSASDVVGGTDNAAPNKFRLASDVLGGTDAAVRTALGFARTTSDTAGVTDDALPGQLRNTSDNVGGTDVATRVLRNPHAGSDTAGGTDAAVRTKVARSRTAADTAGGTDAQAARTKVGPRTTSDTVGGTDIVIRVFRRTSSDTLGGTDAAIRGATLGVTNTVTNVTTQSSTTLLSANFTTAMVGQAISGTNIAPNTVITSVVAGVSATISIAATGSSSGLTLATYPTGAATGYVAPAVTPHSFFLVTEPTYVTLVGGRYVDEVLADSPLLYWRLSETTGTVAADASGHGRTGTFTDGGGGAINLGQASPLVLNEPSDRAIQFVPIGFVISAASTAFDTASMTAEAWIHPTSGSTNKHGVASVMNASGGDRWYVRFQPVTGEVEIYHGGSTYLSGVMVPFNVWTHLVVTFNSADSKYRIYVNGVLAATSSASSLGGATNCPVTAGHNNAGGAGSEAFVGGFDELAVYGTALSGTRIAAHYAASLVAATTTVRGKLILTEPAGAVPASTDLFVSHWSGTTSDGLLKRVDPATGTVRASYSTASQVSPSTYGLKQPGDVKIVNGEPVWFITWRAFNNSSVSSEGPYPPTPPGFWQFISFPNDTLASPSIVSLQGYGSASNAGYSVRSNVYGQALLQSDGTRLWLYRAARNAAPSGGAVITNTLLAGNNQAAIASYDPATGLLASEVNLGNTNSTNKYWCFNANKTAIYTIHHNNDKIYKGTTASRYAAVWYDIPTIHSGASPYTLCVDAVTDHLFICWYDGAAIKVDELDAAGTFVATYSISTTSFGFVPSTLLSADTFNRADSTTNLGSTNGVGALDPLLWTQHWQPQGIISNRAYMPGASTLGIASVDVGGADVDMSIAVSFDFGAAVFRLTNLNNYWIAGMDPSAGILRLFKAVAGSQSQVGSSIFETIADGDTLRVVASGSSIKLYRNGVLKLSATDSFNLTATRCGIYTAGSTVRIDNFSVSTIGSDNINWGNSFPGPICAGDGYLYASPYLEKTGSPHTEISSGIWRINLATGAGGSDAAWTLGEPGGQFFNLVQGLEIRKILAVASSGDASSRKPIITDGTGIGGQTGGGGTGTPVGTPVGSSAGSTGGGTVSTTGTTTPPPTTGGIDVGSALPPSGGYLALQPIGYRIRSDAEAAAMVHVSTWEPRTDNNTANHTVPTQPADLADFSDFDATWNTLYKTKITGNYTGTTDSILQWACAKWGWSDEFLRAELIQESDWHQNSLGDYELASAGHRVYDRFDDPTPVSFSIIQNKWYYHPDGVASNSPLSSYPRMVQSTAFALDIFCAMMRGVYDGHSSFLNGGGLAASGDAWGAIGYWYAGNWHSSEANGYITSVQNHLAAKAWLVGGF